MADPPPTKKRREPDCALPRQDIPPSRKQTTDKPKPAKPEPTQGSESTEEAIVKRLEKIPGLTDGRQVASTAFQNALEETARLKAEKAALEADRAATTQRIMAKIAEDLRSVARAPSGGDREESLLGKIHRREDRDLRERELKARSDSAISDPPNPSAPEKKPLKPKIIGLLEIVFGAIVIVLSSQIDRVGLSLLIVAFGWAVIVVGIWKFNILEAKSVRTQRLFNAGLSGFGALVLLFVWWIARPEQKAPAATRADVDEVKEFIKKQLQPESKPQPTAIPTAVASPSPSPSRVPTQTPARVLSSKPKQQTTKRKKPCSWEDTLLGRCS